MKANKRRKKITLTDIARLASVSVSSVSRVINNHPGIHPDIYSKVEHAIRGLDYQPSTINRRLEMRRSRLICFLLANRDLHIQTHSRILQSVERTCSRNGDLLFFRTISYAPDTASQELDVAELLKIPLPGSKGILPDGVILSGFTYPNLLNALNLAGIPVILLENNYIGSSLSADAVTVDGFAGAYAATCYLIDLGHTNILFIGDVRLNWFARLYEGYLQALKEHGLKPIAQTKGLSDNFYSNGCLSVSIVFEQTTEVTAVFAGYDDTALGAWKALSDRNLSVPRDVSLIGFDDLDYAAFTIPPLTTVRFDAEAVGRELVSQLYKKLQDPSVSLPVIKLHTSLLKRGTCHPVGVLTEAAR